MKYSIILVALLVTSTVAHAGEYDQFCDDDDAVCLDEMHANALELTELRKHHGKREFGCAVAFAASHPDIVERGHPTKEQSREYVNFLVGCLK